MKIIILFLVSWEIQAQEFYLIRHGEYDGNNLTENGKVKISETAKKIKNNIVAIYHSPKTRTKESAEIISSVTGCKNVISSQWLSDDVNFDPAWLLKIKEEIVVIVSHGPILAEIAKTLGSNVNKWNYAQMTLVIK